MKETFLNIRNQLRNKFGGKQEESPSPEVHGSDYVELSHDTGDTSNKARVQQFILQDFEDIKPILDSLRSGSTIALINIQPLKERDIVELKRAINKLKKTCDALGGDLAGFGEDYVVATPEFAYIHRGNDVPAQPEATSFDPL